METGLKNGNNIALSGNIITFGNDVARAGNIYALRNIIALDLQDSFHISHERVAALRYGATLLRVSNIVARQARFEQQSCVGGPPIRFMEHRATPHTIYEPSSEMAKPGDPPYDLRAIERDGQARRPPIRFTSQIF
jgi:hypothetical protein